MKGNTLLLQKTQQKLRLPEKKTLRDCLLLFCGGFLLSGARVAGQILPLGACIVSAAGGGLRLAACTAGSIAGYVLLCDPVQSAQYIALCALLLAAEFIFRGTMLPAARWFMPTIASVVSAILGSVYLLSGKMELLSISLWASKWLLAGLATDGFRCAFQGNRRCAVFAATALLSGLTSLPLPIDLGLACGAALMTAAPELTVPAAVGIALDLSGAYAHCATLAMMLPSVLCRTLRLRAPMMRAALLCVLPAAVFACFGVATAVNTVTLAVGIAGGFLLRRSGLLRFSAQLSENARASERLADAAQTLEALHTCLSQEEQPYAEADGVFDGAAERICRCCGRFRICWGSRAKETYTALNEASRTILAQGRAEAADFPEPFQKRCCHMDGFLTAVNQELEGMLYRRRYRMQLKESREALAEELKCTAQYLRQAQQGVRRARAAYLPAVGISTVPREENGDRGVCFTANAMCYVLLCDGMGTGAEASEISGETVRLLRRLLKSGMEAESAMRMVNDMLLLSAQGRFATMDLLAVDLVTADAALYKWGAACSYYRSGENIEKIGTASPPPGVGVGKDHGPQRYELSLRRGEMLLLVSDGADGEQAQTILSAFSGDDPRQLAALLIAQSESADDVTAAAVCLRLRT